MTFENWIEIRSGLGGQPTLVEDRSVFATLELLRFHPRVIAAIGGRSKREIFGDNVIKNRVSSSVPGVRVSARSKSQFLIDCELHENVTLATVNVLPPAGSRRHRTLQALIPPTHLRQTLLNLYFDFYWQVIFPFVPLVLLFLDDIDDNDLIIELLADWMKKSISSPALSPPRLIIVHKDHDTSIPEFLSQLQLRLAAFVSPRAASHTGSDAMPQCETAFKCIELLPVAAVSLRLVDTYVEESFSFREKAGFAFSGEHLKNLLETAVDLFCAGHGRQLDLYHAARLANPSYKDLQPHITHFMDITSNLAIDHEEVIASTLDFDAHPPRMHRFQPSQEFDKFYLETVAKSNKSNSPGRSIMGVRRRYIELASERQGGSSARSHVNLLAQFKFAWRSCFSHKTCLVCLAQRPSNPLSCGHSLCDPCVIVCGQVLSASGCEIEIKKCPLCEIANGKATSLRPPTAGVRVLALEGSLESKLTLWQFVRELHYYLGMSLPLYQHFDLIFGTGIGSFFALTLFVEQWELCDCKYHLKSLFGPIEQKRSSVVSFGTGLEWDVNETLRSNGALACLQIRDRLHSNLDPHLVEFQGEGIKRSSDVYIRCSGEKCNAGFMQAAAGRLIACLFYLELLSAPTFYSTPEYVHVLLRCRLPEGQQLLTLVKHFHRLKTLVHYQGDEAKPSSEMLVTPEILRRCRKGEKFCKHIRMKAHGFHTILDVKMDGIAGGKENISNCPYQLDKLIADQGLRQVFGSKNHRMSNEPSDPEYDATIDMVRLRDTLDNVIVSYSKLTESIYSSDGIYPDLRTCQSSSTDERRSFI